jgi:DNA-binding NtrC family response regulator
MMAQGKLIRDIDLPDALRIQAPKSDKSIGIMTLEEVQAQHVEFVLKMLGGNKARAAEVLGVSRATIYDMLARRARHEHETRSTSTQAGA